MVGSFNFTYKSNKIWIPFTDEEKRKKLSIYDSTHATTQTSCQSVHLTHIIIISRHRLNIELQTVQKKKNARKPQEWVNMIQSLYSSKQMN